MEIASESEMIICYWNNPIWIPQCMTFLGFDFCNTISAKDYPFVIDKFKHTDHISRMMCSKGNKVTDDILAVSCRGVDIKNQLRSMRKPIKRQYNNPELWQLYPRISFLVNRQFMVDN